MVWNRLTWVLKLLRHHFVSCVLADRSKKIATTSSTQTPRESCMYLDPLNVSYSLMKTCDSIRKESNILSVCPLISSWTYSYPPSIDILHGCLVMGCCDISYILVPRRNSPNSSSMEVEESVERLLPSELFIAVAAVMANTVAVINKKWQTSTAKSWVSHKWSYLPQSTTQKRQTSLQAMNLPPTSDITR